MQPVLPAPAGDPPQDRRVARDHRDRHVVAGALAADGRRGLVVAEEYTSRQAIDALGAGTGLADLLCRLVSAATRGRLTADHSEITLVIRKPENRFARVI